MTDEPVTHPGAPSRTPRVLAIALFALALAGCLTAIVTALASGMSFSAAVNAYTVTDGAMALAFPVCGVLLAWHRPRNPIGWLFLAAGLGMASTTWSAAPDPGGRSGLEPGDPRLCPRWRRTGGPGRSRCSFRWP